MKMKFVLLAGAPGSGKSTHGKRLEEKNANIKHISVGNEIRAIRQNPEHPITKKYKNLIDNSEFLPEDVVLEIVSDILNKDHNKDIVILLDGYPRTEPQYEKFKEKYGKPNCIIHLDADTDKLVDRMKDRAGRQDNTAEIINKRLKVHNDTTDPLLAKIMEELKENNITANTGGLFEETNSAIYAKLQAIPEINETLNAETTKLSDCKLVKTLFNDRSATSQQMDYQLPSEQIRI